jgi:hypothetical protein
LNVLPGTPCFELVEIGYLPASPKERVERVFDWFFLNDSAFPAGSLFKENSRETWRHTSNLSGPDEFWKQRHGLPVSAV